MFDCCLNADNVRLTLKKTFEFIQQNQVSSNGDILETTVIVGLNLLKTQLSDKIEDRVSAENTVTGIISAVNDTNVIFITKSEFAGKSSEYTIEYSSIIEVITVSLAINFNLYRLYMSKLPPICKEDTQYTEMLELLETLLDEENQKEYIGFQLTFNSVQSRIILFSELEIVKNLIIISEIFVIPLTYIGGFALIPKCLNEATTVEAKKEGVLNV